MQGKTIKGWHGGMDEYPGFDRGDPRQVKDLIRRTNCNQHLRIHSLMVQRQKGIPWNEADLEDAGELDSCIRDILADKRKTEHRECPGRIAIHFDEKAMPFWRIERCRRCRKRWREKPVFIPIDNPTWLWHFLPDNADTLKSLSSLALYRRKNGDFWPYVQYF